MISFIPWELKGATEFCSYFGDKVYFLEKKKEKKTEKGTKKVRIEVKSMSKKVWFKGD